MTTAWHRQFCPEMGAGFGGAPGMRRLKQTPPGRSSGACRCGGPLAESRGTGSVSEFLQTSQLHTSRRGPKKNDLRPPVRGPIGGPYKTPAKSCPPPPPPRGRRNTSLSPPPRFSVHSGGPSIRRAYCAAPGLQPTMRRSSSKSRTAPHITSPPLTAAKCARAHWSFAASTPWGCGALPLVSATK